LAKVNGKTVLRKDLKTNLKAPITLTLEELMFAGPERPKTDWYFDYALAARGHDSKRKPGYGPDKSRQNRSYNAGDDSCCASKSLLCVADGVGEFREGASYWSQLLVEKMYDKAATVSRGKI